MTINVGRFTDYPKLGGYGKAPYNTCSPNLLLVGAEMDRLFGSRNDGCFGVRDTRNGQAISTHAFGDAMDRSFRYAAPSVAERRVKSLAACEWLRTNSAELGIQAIHDYAGCRIWRSNRDPKVYPDGWKIQPPDQFGMGQSWGDWIHLEDYVQARDNTTPIADRLNEPVAGGGHDLPTERPVIGPGSSGPLVKAVQTFLTVRANQGAVVGKADGKWGPRTSGGWSNFVMWMNALHPGSMSTDGNVVGSDWNVVAWEDRGWGNLYAAGFPQGI